MRYMFRILVLGDPLISIPFIESSGLKFESQDFELSRWSSRLNVGLDTCDLDVDVVVNMSIDYDGIIPTSDGIVYFLDPNNIQEFELFDMIAKIINDFKRRIPLIVVFFSKSRISLIPSNYLLEYIWQNYLFEAFTFDRYSENSFIEVLECLSESIISGMIPLNINTAWMKIPTYLIKINDLILENKWEEAAKYAEVFSIIKKRFEKHDYLINFEQSAWLYYKSGDYLNASNLLADINEEDSKKLKKYYITKMLLEGDQLFKIKRYKSAAEKYEKAAIWSSIELDDEELTNKSIEKSISTWIYAGEFQNSFRLIERLDHLDQLEMMKKIVKIILYVADQIIKNQDFEIIKGQLYYCIDKYQRMGLFEEVKELGKKIMGVLNNLIDQYIAKEDPDSALLTIEEYFNIIETFDIKGENIDNKVAEVSKLFIQNRQFTIIDKLINFINSKELQNEINDILVKYEEKYKKELKDKQIEQYNNAKKLLEKYILNEVSMFQNYNQKIYSYVDKLINEDSSFWEASLILKERAEWYQKIGHIKIFEEISIRLLKIYLKGLYLAQFIQYIKKLSTKTQYNFLKNSNGQIINALEKMSENNENFSKIQKIIDILVRLYREHLLYDESRELIRLKIKFIISRVSYLTFATNDLRYEKEILENLKEAEILYNSLSEKEPLDVDKILAEIVNRYIQNNLLNKAHQLNEKIRNPQIFSELHKKILELEEEKSKIKIEGVKKEIDGKIKAEELSLLKNMARDQLLSKRELLEKRSALKRIYYQKILNKLHNNDYEEAIKLYKNVTLSLIKRKKLDSAGIGPAMITIILFKLNNIDRIEQIISEINNEIKSSKDIFHQVFSMRVVDYIIEMVNFNEKAKAIEALQLFEALPLFEEEKSLLYSVINKKPRISLDHNVGQVHEKTIRQSQNFKIDNTTHDHITKSINSSQSNTNKIINQSTFISKNSLKESAETINYEIIDKLIGKLKIRENLATKRKMMRRKYWQNALSLIKQQNYIDASREYLSQIDQLTNNNHLEQIPLAVLMAILSAIKAGNNEFAKSTLEKVISNLNDPSELLKKYPEYILLQDLFQAIKKDDSKLKDIILHGFLSLPLFDIEKDLINSLISNQNLDMDTLYNKQTPAKKNISETNIMLEQQLSYLKQSLTDFKLNSKEILEKRKAMRRIYYNNILRTLEEKNYEKAANLYKNVALRISQRNDYNTSAILILLGGLSLSKLTNNPDDLKNYLDDFLNNLGFTQNIVKETFALKLFKLLIDSIKLNQIGIFRQCKNLLNLLPLFDEEKVLIDLNLTK
ncbi:MAG: hypothetical protein ACTSU2_10125 [Promethearchaeota archaeon]